jgi:hypothetical protein
VPGHRRCSTVARVPDLHSSSSTSPRQRRPPTNVVHAHRQARHLMPDQHPDTQRLLYEPAATKAMAGRRHWRKVAGVHAAGALWDPSATLSQPLSHTASFVADNCFRAVSARSSTTPCPQRGGPAQPLQRSPGRAASRLTPPPTARSFRSPRGVGAVPPRCPLTNKAHARPNGATPKDPAKPPKAPTHCGCHAERQRGHLVRRYATLQPQPRTSTAPAAPGNLHQNPCRWRQAQEVTEGCSAAR